MSLVLKRKINKWILTVVILILALIYVYPIFLMCINAVKPFGEVVVDVIKSLELQPKQAISWAG